MHFARPTGWSHRAWLFLLLALAIPARAVTPAGLDVQRVSLLALPTLQTLSAPLQVSGRAPAGCPPALESIAADGLDLDLTLALPAAGCDAARRESFRLRVDPAAAGQLLLPGQTYRVRVHLARPGGTDLMAFRLLDTRDRTSTPLRPESGFWWLDSETGASAAAASGLALETQGPQLAASLFGFDPEGRATWHFGSARLEGRVAHLELVGVEDPGAGTGAPVPSSHPGPRLELEFLSPMRVRAWLVEVANGQDIAVHPFHLRRKPFAAGSGGHSWTGAWLLVPEGGARPRRFDFRLLRETETGWELSDPSRGAHVSCRLRAALPEACTLATGDLTLARFDLIGLDRMDGLGSDSSPVMLLRLSR